MEFLEAVRIAAPVFSCHSLVHGEVLEELSPKVQQRNVA